jgi:DNA-binding beta-propeller fold protein YncE
MWLLFVACRHPEAPDGSSSARSTVVLTASSYFGDVIHLFDPATAQLLGKITGLDGPQTVVAGPDGDWIACSELDNAVVRIDPATLAVSGSLIADDPATEADETGGLKNPDAAAFGPDGRLYVSSFETDQVLRYESDGTFVDAAVDAGEGGLDGPDIGLGFDPDGNLIVPGWYSDRIHCYAPDGTPLDDLVTKEDGLDSPREVLFDAAGRAYVSGFDSDTVLRVDATGAVEVFATVDGASGLALDGETLFVASGADDTIRAFDVSTGEDLGVRVDFRPIDGITVLRLLTLP